MYSRQSSFDGLCLEGLAGAGTDDFSAGVPVDPAGRAMRNKRRQLEDLVEISSDKDLSSCSDCQSNSSDSSSIENSESTHIVLNCAHAHDDGEAAIFIDFWEPYRILESTPAWARLCRFDGSIVNTMRSFLGPASNLGVLRKAVSRARSSDCWCEESRIILYDVDGDPMHLRIDARRVVRLCTEGEIMCAQLRLRPVYYYQ
jgi:hypothetical protein